MLTIVIGTCQAAAFGSKGHRMVAEIAMRYLSPLAKANVLKALGTMTPAAASTWMDEMRGDPDYDFMKPWHFVNIPKGGTFDATQGDNIITALNHAFNDIRLKRVSAEKQRSDLLLIFHLIGDLHQPLHTGYKADLGGNKVEVVLSGSKTDLHHLWDSDLITNRKITVEGCLDYGKGAAANVAFVKSGTFVDWMKQSRLQLATVYAFKGSSIDEAYLKKNKAVAERLLFNAGVRLATVLEALYGNNQQSTQFGNGNENISSGLHDKTAFDTPAAHDAGRC